VAGESTGLLRDAPWRVAPLDADGPLPATTRVTGTGILIDGGRRAVAPLTAADGTRALWVRDGRGRRRVAHVERHAEDAGLALLRLEAPLDGGAGLTLAPRDPFSGSPAFAIEYSSSADSEPTWPILRTGFVGTIDATGVSTLGIAARAGARGGLVFDAGGRFVGIAMPNADGRDRLLTVSGLRREFGDRLGTIASQATPPRVTVDSLYERALPVTLQVIVGERE